MLILTRRPGEVIKIGGDVEVTVLGIKGNQVRIGVKAPRETVVDREEVALKRIENPRDQARG
jgi:carbon storage regulator